MEGLRHYREAQPLIGDNPSSSRTRQRWPPVWPELPTICIMGGELDIRPSSWISTQRSRLVWSWFICHRTTSTKTNAELRLREAAVIRMEAGANYGVLREPSAPGSGALRVSVSIFDESGKQTVAQMLNAASVELTGPLSGVCATPLVPLSVKLVAWGMSRAKRARVTLDLERRWTERPP